MFNIVIERPVIVITPTIGSDKLSDAVESVKNQTYSNVKHLVVSDGRQFLDRIPELVKKSADVISVPYNTGRNNFYGHRIYSAFPHLVDEDYICFLDEDNWFEPTHIESLVNTIESNPAHFAFSLRKIFDENKRYVCDDDCESLGHYPIFGQERNGYLVDTSSYLFRKDWLIQYCHLWHNQWGADRVFFNQVKDISSHVCTGYHSLCYRLDGNPGSSKPEMFLELNKVTDQSRPWNKKQ